MKRHARNPFWRETGYAECANYAPYARGGGYIVSMDLAVYLARATDKLQRWKGEDASVGTWLAPLKLERRHDIGEGFFFSFFESGIIWPISVLSFQKLVDYQLS